MKKLTSLEELQAELEVCKTIKAKKVWLPIHDRPHAKVSKEDYEANPENYVIMSKGNNNEAIAPRCTATAKHRKSRCNNMSVRGMPVCRFHGGAADFSKITRPSGKSHHLYKHGERSRAGDRERAQKTGRNKALTRVAHEYGLME